jgi:hypothetical protein
MKMNFNVTIVVVILGVRMRKILFVIFIFLFFVSESFAYSIKVYDQMGNRVGTYRKEGDNFVLYDFHDKKVDAPSCEEASSELPLWFMLILSRGKKPYITDHVFP